MLFFLACLFFILEGSKSDKSNLTAPTDGHDVSLVSRVEDTLGECSTLVQVVGDFMQVYDKDGTRRRNDDTIAPGVQAKLDTCTAIVEAVDTFREDYVDLTFREDYVPWTLGYIRLGIAEMDFIKKLLSDTSKEMGDVLYVASKDGDSSTNFHNACDGKGATVVIVESTAGAIFGAYTDLSWGIQNNYASSSKSFLFRVRPTMTHYAIMGGKESKAVYRGSSYGPTLGSGHDLYIATGARSNTNSQTNGGHSYTFPSYPNYQLTDGQRYFQVKDYVVLQAI